MYTIWLANYNYSEILSNGYKISYIVKTTMYVFILACNGLYSYYQLHFEFLWFLQVLVTQYVVNINKLWCLTLSL